jgi:hypothetical protein
MFTDRCLETGVCLSAYCIATAVLVVHLEVSTQQRIYTPQYDETNRNAERRLIILSRSMCDYRRGLDW